MQPIIIEKYGITAKVNHEEGEYMVTLNGNSAVRHTIDDAVNTARLFIELYRSASGRGNEGTVLVTQGDILEPGQQHTEREGLNSKATQTCQP